ncbi:MAG: LysM peptidoglycan-binding domain-containing protein [Phycisphaerales bacterium]|nr:LysM peptidoglycan-binding domain-containing protein [Phycisphaerales bacterium]
MQRMALGQGLVTGAMLAAAVVMFSGCKDKNEGMTMGRSQSSSVAYEDPSSSYYAPGTLNSDSSSGYTYNDGSQGASTTSSAALTGGNRHVVAKGDTLYSIARAYYNDQAKWRTIYDANRSAIPDPNKLSVGQELIIP